MKETDFSFKWSDLGDISLGRPNLGNTTYVAVYRMLQFSVRSALAKEYGGEAAQRIFYNAGEMAGKEMCKNMLNKKADACSFFDELSTVLKQFNIGIMKLEKLDDEKQHYTVTIEEDLDCSGLPSSDETVCGFDEGFIAGVLKEYMGVDFLVTEIDCWSQGQKLCRFEISKN